MKIIILTYLLISLISPTLSAQCEVNKLTSLLYSSDVHDPINAAQRIADCNLEELIPLLKERLYDENYLYAAHKILFALAKLDAENLEQITLDFIRNVDNLTLLTPDDPLGSKVYATQILFNLHNYSTIDYIFELFDRDKPQVNQTALYLFPIIAQNIPNYSLQAKNELIYAFENNVDTEYRSLAISFLVSLYGGEMLDDVVEMLNTSSKLSDKRQAYNLINRINDASLNSFLKDRLPIEQEWTLRILISDSLLIKFGEPSDLKAVIDYLSFETHSTVSYSISAEIENFIPPKPEGLSYNDLFLRLISYTDEMFGYDWIQNEETRDYYIQKLSNIDNVLNNNATAEACTIINEQLLPKAEQDLKEKLITTEGYKFLHYYTIYIKEEIEKEFGSCQ